MQSTPITKYVHLGTVIRYLEDQEGMSNPPHWESLILANIERFQNYLSELGLTVTKNYARELVDIKNVLEEYEENEVISKDDASKLSKLMKEIRKVFEAEAVSMRAFILTENRFDNEKLLEDMWKLFAKNIFNDLWEYIKKDFNEAWKCIAFHLPTAAAFHLLRWTEWVLKTYHKKYLRKKH